jgi:hypothetical protein
VAERFLVRPFRGVWLGGALFGAVGLMAIAVPAGPLAIDRRWSEAMRDIQALALSQFAEAGDRGERPPGDRDVDGRRLGCVVAGLVALCWTATACGTSHESST